MPEIRHKAEIYVNYDEAQTRQNLSSGEEIRTVFGKIKKWFADMGTAAFKDVPSSGDAGNSEIVLGNDSRLSDARTPTAHTQASNTITAMTGYTKPQSTSAITASDTLNSAIGKLEKAVDDAGGGGSTLELSSYNVTLTDNSLTQTVTVTAHSGTVSINLLSGDNFAVSLSGDTITITNSRVDGIYEQGAILVMDATQSGVSQKIINIYRSGLKIVSWASGTEAELGEMITAARQGIINLTNYWSEGDVRVVNNQRYVLMNGSTYIDGNGNSQSCAFKVIVDTGSGFSWTQKSLNISTKTYYMVSADTVSLSFLNTYQLKFIASEVRLSKSGTSAIKSESSRVVKAWYASGEELTFLYPSNSGEYVNGRCVGLSEFNYTKDPLYPTEIGSSSMLPSITPKAYYMYTNSNGSLVSGQSYNKVCSNNWKCIMYFLI